MSTKETPETAEGAEKKIKKPRARLFDETG